MMRLAMTRLALVIRLALVTGMTGFAANAAATEPPPRSEEPPYRLAGKRDPFQTPAGVEKSRMNETADPTPTTPARPREPLEAFQLDSLKLVAILRSNAGWPPAAMVQDPQGKGHLVRQGFHIGTREGEVLEIGDGVVTIREPPPSLEGAPRIITLRLHEEKTP
ncbi:MAG: pilus assembly protein PilP [Magnetococcales bacterium]|nr:pilus assembly protein PilP [Magnetococcales bacterium]